MRILHVSDAHCSTSNLLRLLESEEFDIVVATGDFECEDTARALADAGVKAVAVTGNMDHAGVASILRKSGILIEGEVVELGGLVFAGVGGMDVVSSLSKLTSRLSRSPDVLVTHHPPKGAVDRTFIGIRGGLGEIRRLVEEYKPRLHLCGHIHESRGSARLGGTLVVNAGPLSKGYYAVIEWGEEIKVRHLRI